jgi:tetratricopeptide (TPR) repeat protein
VRALAAIAWLIPVVAGGLTAGRLVAAAWHVASAGEDPIVARIHPTELTVESLDRAADLAWLDFRYPFRSGRASWQAGGGSAQVTAHERFLEAVDRAPTHAEARYYLSRSAYAMGELALADDQARAALSLAPMHLELRRRVAEYFFRDRFNRTRSREHLRDTIRAMRTGMVPGFLEDYRLEYEDVRHALRVTGATTEESLSRLMGAKRWEWAVRLAAEADGEEEGGHRREAGVRIEHARELLGLGAVRSAAREAERARELCGGDFTEWMLLARARLRSGKEEAGLEAVAEAARRGATVEELAGALEGTNAALVWWSERVESGDDRPPVRMALAQAYLAAGRAEDANPLLLELTEEAGLRGEAHYLLSRSFLDRGNRKLALRHAKQAVRESPVNQSYRDHLKAVQRGGGR